MPDLGGAALPLKIDNVGATTAAVGSLVANLKKIGLAAAGIYSVDKALKFTTNSALEFNEAMHDVWTLTDKTAGQLQRLSADVRTFARGFNISATQTAKALYQIYSATFYGADAMKILDASTKGAAAGLADVYHAADMTTTILNAYRMSAEKAIYVQDLLFTAVKYGKLRYDELTQQFGRLAGVAAPVGARLEEMTAALATLTRAGIQTDWAVTSLRQTLMQLLRPTRTLKESIQSMGYASGAALVKAVGFAEALKLIAKYAEENNIGMEQMFTNVRAVTGVLPLTTTLAGEYVKDLERMATASGMMSIAFQKQAEAWTYQLAKAKTAIQDTAISIGNNLAPAFVTLLKAVNALLTPIKYVGEALNKIGGAQALTVAAGIGTITVAIWALNKAFLALRGAVAATGLTSALVRIIDLGGKLGASTWLGGLLRGGAAIGGGLLGIGAAVRGLTVDIPILLNPEVTGAERTKAALRLGLEEALGGALGGAVIAGLFGGSMAVGGIVGAAVAGLGVLTIRIIHEIKEGISAAKAGAAQAAEAILSTAILPRTVTGGSLRGLAESLIDAEPIIEKTGRVVTATADLLEDYYTQLEDGTWVLNDSSSALQEFRSDVAQTTLGFGTASDAAHDLETSFAGAAESAVGFSEAVAGDVSISIDSTAGAVSSAIHDWLMSIDPIGTAIWDAKEQFKALWDELTSGNVTLTRAQEIWKELADGQSEWTDVAEMAASAFPQYSDAIKEILDFLADKLGGAIDPITKAVDSLYDSFAIAKKAYEESAAGTLRHAIAQETLASISQKLAGYQEALGLDAADLTGKWKEMAEWLKSVGIEIKKITISDYGEQIAAYGKMLSAGREGGNVALQVSAIGGLQGLADSISQEIEKIKDTIYADLIPALQAYLDQIEREYGIIPTGTVAAETWAEQISDLIAIMQNGSKTARERAEAESVLLSLHTQISQIAKTTKVPAIRAAAKAAIAQLESVGITGAAVSTTWADQIAELSKVMGDATRTAQERATAESSLISLYGQLKEIAAETSLETVRIAAEAAMKAIAATGVAVEQKTETWAEQITRLRAVMHDGSAALEERIAAEQGLNSLYSQIESAIDEIAGTALEKFTPALRQLLQLIIESGAKIPKAINPTIASAQSFYDNVEKLKEAFAKTEEGTVAHILASHGLAEALQTAKGYVAELTDEEIAANPKLLNLISSIEDLGITADTTKSAIDRFNDALSAVSLSNLAAGIETAFQNLETEFLSADTLGKMADALTGLISGPQLLRAMLDNLERIITSPTASKAMKQFAKQLHDSLEGAYPEPGKTYAQIEEERQRAAEEAKRKAEQAAREAEQAAREAAQRAQEAFREQFTAPILKAISTGDWMSAAQAIKEFARERETYIRKAASLSDANDQVIDAIEVMGLITGAYRELLSQLDAQIQLMQWAGEDASALKELKQNIEDLFDPLGALKRKIREILGIGEEKPRESMAKLREILVGIAKRAGYQTGGFVPGKGAGDKIPAMLEPGEFVIPKWMMQLPGLGNLIYAIWKGGKRFAAGGPTCSGGVCYLPDETPAAASPSIVPAAQELVAAFEEGADAVDKLTEAAKPADEVWNLYFDSAKEYIAETETLISQFSELGLSTVRLEIRLRNLRAGFSGLTPLMYEFKKALSNIVDSLKSATRDLVGAILRRLFASFLNLGEEAESLGSSLNIPTGYKVAQAAWRAAVPGEPGLPIAGGGEESLADKLLAIFRDFIDQALGILADTLSGLVWTDIIPFLSWNKFIEFLGWNNFLKPIEWRKWIKGINWKDLINPLEWPKLFGNLVGQTGEWIKDAIDFIFGEKALGALLPGIAPLLEGLATFLGTIVEVVGFLIQFGANLGFLEGVVAIAVGVIEGLSDVISSFLQPIFEAMGKAWQKLQPLIDAVREALASLVPMGEVVGKVIGMGIALMTDLFVALTPIIDAFGKLWTTLVSLFAPVIKMVANLFGVILTPAIRILGGLLEALGGIIRLIIYPFRVLATIIRNVGVAFHNFIEFVKHPFAPGKRENWAYQPVPKLQAGGVVLQEGLAYLHANELVLPPAQVMQPAFATGTGQLVIHTHVYLRDREIADAVNEVNRDTLGRKTGSTGGWRY